MIKIGDTEIYVGAKEEIRKAKTLNMAIVNAVRNCTGYECHQTVVGWTQKRACPETSPYYYFKEDDINLFLNLIDTKNVEYIPDVIINQTIKFIDDKLGLGKSIFICCSLGESRSPSLALIYLLDKKILESKNCVEVFRSEYYNNYKPKKGYIDYINNRFMK